MKAKTFDAFTKFLATPESRRQALQKILGMVGGGSLAMLLSGKALADDDKNHYPTTTHRPTTTCHPTTTHRPTTTCHPTTTYQPTTTTIPPTTTTTISPTTIPP